jgi:hypothetical protein
MEQNTQGSQLTRGPDHATIANWTVDALTQMPAQIIRNAWWHTGFSYFPDEENISVDAVHGEEDDGSDDGSLDGELVPAIERCSEMIDAAFTDEMTESDSESDGSPEMVGI